MGTTDHAPDVVWVEFSESDLLRFFEQDGSPLLETTAGEAAQALDVPVWELHNKLQVLAESGRVWAWDSCTFTFCKTTSRSDLSRYHAAKIGFFRHGRKGIPQSVGREPDEIDFDVDISEARYDFMDES